MNILMHRFPTMLAARCGNFNYHSKELIVTSKIGQGSGSRIATNGKNASMEAMNGTPPKELDPYAELDLSTYMQSLKVSVKGYVRTEKELVKMQLTERAGSVMAVR